MLFLGTGKQLSERPQHRKDRRLPAALLLGKAFAALADLARDPVGAAVTDLRGIEARQMTLDRRQQHRTALVQRLDRESAPARGQDQRRIDKPHVPARVTARKLETRREQDAPPVVEAL